MAADGADHQTIENNVQGDWLAVRDGSPFRQPLGRPFWGGGTCDYKLQCGVLYLGNKPRDPVSRGTTLTDNILTRVCVVTGRRPGVSLRATTSSQSERAWRRMTFTAPRRIRGARAPRGLRASR
jgi:hypothetical protein